MSSPASIAPILPAVGLPVSMADQTGVPAAVREGSPAARQAYTSARGFEEMLLEALTQSLVQGSGVGEGEAEAAGGGAQAEEEGSGAQAGGGVLGSLLGQALSEGVIRHGGAGLAGQLMGELDPTAARPPTAETGGTPA